MNSTIRAVLSTACLILCLGCEPAAQVQTYSVARTAPPRPPLDAAALLEQLDHILVAIVPQNDKAWFFKVSGKAPVIARQRQAFLDFLQTVELADDRAQPPRWDLPDGWSEKEATAMRTATLVIPDTGGDLELAVSSLPLTSAWDDFLVPNVNRWVGQLQRAQLPKQTILKLKNEVQVGGSQAAWFELSGLLSDRRMGSNPHAGLGVAPPPKSTPSSSTTQTSTPPAARGGKLTYEKPDEWLPGKQSSMRQAAFLLPGGSSSDEVTVTRFPDAPGTQMGDVGANVQRWAGQVGLGQLSAEQLAELAKPITISGIEGTYVELVSPESAARSAALFAAMIKREGQIWFFKMVGDRELVSSQREAFREFLGSVQLP